MTVRKDLCASCHFEAFGIADQAEFEAWQQVIESEVDARTVLTRALEHASGSDVDLLTAEIQRRKLFLLEILCKDGQLLGR